MDIYLYLPYDIKYLDNSIKIIKNIFGKNIKLIDSLPFNQEINNGILWINSHGFKRNSEHDFLIEVSKIRKDNLKYCNIINDKIYLPSENFIKMFKIKNSIILFDSCYSSEIDIRTLGNWKSNLIFTTGYIQDFYNNYYSGLIKIILIIYNELKKEKKINNLNYEIIKENKDLINEICKRINKEFKTQFSLF